MIPKGNYHEKYTESGSKLIAVFGSVLLAVYNICRGLEYYYIMDKAVSECIEKSELRQ